MASDLGILISSLFFLEHFFSTSGPCVFWTVTLAMEGVVSLDVCHFILSCLWASWREHLTLNLFFSPWNIFMDYPKVRMYLQCCHAADFPMDCFGQHQALCHCSYTITAATASKISPGSGICTINCGHACVETAEGDACPSQVARGATPLQMFGDLRSKGRAGLSPGDVTVTAGEKHCHLPLLP